MHPPSSHPTPESSPPLVCNLAALAATERAAHEALSAHLLEHARRDVQELPNGYAFRFDADAYTTLTRFVANERRCCPFFRFELDVAPAQGSITLRLTGEPGVKEFLRDNLLGRPT